MRPDRLRAITLSKRGQLSVQMIGLTQRRKAQRFKCCFCRLPPLRDIFFGLKPVKDAA